MDLPSKSFQHFHEQDVPEPQGTFLVLDRLLNIQSRFHEEESALITF